MKKTILAAAALATLSTAALAQSSVTLYGVMDASLESVHGRGGVGTVTRVSSDNLATSRIGFKGTEDMGAGMKANFVLEAGVKADTGAADATRLFNRAAWVGLSNASFGEVRLGRQDSAIGGLIASAIGAQNNDESVIANTFGGKTYRRIDNAITYVAPTLVSGLSAQVQYSTAVNASAAETALSAEAVKGSDTGKSAGLSVAYAAGPIGAGVAYIYANGDKAAPPVTGANKFDNNAVFVFGSYDFGLAKLTAYFDQDHTSKTATLTNKRTLAGFKVAVPVTSMFTVTAGAAQVNGVEFIKGQKAQIYSVGGQYNLSKRTALYSLFDVVQNDKKSQLRVAGDAPITTTAAALGRVSSVVAVGVRHSF